MKNFVKIILSLIIASTMITTTALASEKTDAEILVTKATTIVKGFGADPDLDWFRIQAKKAKALLIIPQNLKGAFLIGGSGGSGVLVVRDSKSGSGEWSYPAFYTLGAVSIGLQIGAEASEVILMVMTERGMESLLTSSFKLGADVSIAAGPVGGGITAKTADVLSYSRTKGAFAGMSLDGAVIKTRDGRNSAYYGKKVSPADIIIRKSVSSPQADELRSAVAQVANP